MSYLTWTCIYTQNMRYLTWARIDLHTKHVLSDLNMHLHTKHALADLNMHLHTKHALSDLSTHRSTHKTCVSWPEHAQIYTQTHRQAREKQRQSGGTTWMLVYLTRTLSTHNINQPQARQKWRSRTFHILQKLRANHLLIVNGKKWAVSFSKHELTDSELWLRDQWFQGTLRENVALPSWQARSQWHDKV